MQRRAIAGGGFCDGAQNDDVEDSSPRVVPKRENRGSVIASTRVMVGGAGFEPATPSV